MRLTNLPVEFKKARPVLQRIEKAGYQAYFVGGSVRDTIIGVPIHDVDITSSAYPQEIKQLFPRTVDTGIKHGTVMVLYHGHGYEITTFRTESGYQDYRRPDHVTFVRSLPKDLKRRDFTINALAMRENGEVTDLFDGLGDIKRKVIKAVGNPDRRFHEDALRMMRAVRFASKLDFKIEPKTLEAIKKYSFLLTKIAIERVHSEFVKMMMGLKPRMGLDYMIETNLYRYVPEFKDQLDALKRISKIPHLKLTNECQVWSLISYEFGLNRHQINHLLRQWKSADKVIDDTITTTRTLRAIHDHKLTPIVIFKAGLTRLMDANHLAILLGFGDQDADLKKQFKQIPIARKNQLKINGGILIKGHILAPGPKLGQVINQLELMVINRQIPNQEPALLTAAKKLSK
ncbi:CCA tRNA nucleotidyltransferase [Acetilactobacillus jinshanensis]|uniref:CCA-adding enzyme n=1 Tax=Acetilactobacillus jinshanensis TaxID=1720083 RepID=A0A4P6ZKD0_9LACO|nr:CCA tRNA nucleotidyltransferase [Acetilactobacillus jinshanensis]QBP18013.1 CCA tRNA nucleotidyltransferase [Acetilactobacillus jinshanensis]URL60875.1 CCA tRNA nucleotidyltransferase [uncultured bacterium]